MDDLAQSINVLLARVPRPVREYVISDLSNEVQSLMGRYQLHVDQGGVLQRELLLMLLGQQEPAGFMKELATAGIEQGKVQSMMVDINEEIFKPLRKREQEAPPESAAPAPTPPPAPRPTPAAPPPPPPDRGVRTMEMDQQQALAQPQPPTYAPPTPQAFPPGSQTQTYWVPVSITATPQPYMAQSPQYAYPPQAPAPPPPPPAPVAPPPPPPPPVVEERWQPPPPPNLPTEERPSIPLRKEYGNDPYREPV